MVRVGPKIEGDIPGSKIDPKMKLNAQTMHAEIDRFPYNLVISKFDHLLIYVLSIFQLVLKLQCYGSSKRKNTEYDINNNEIARSANQYF